MGSQTPSILRACSLATRSAESSFACSRSPQQEGHLILRRCRRRAQSERGHDRCQNAEPAQSLFHGLFLSAVCVTIRLPNSLRNRGRPRLGETSHNSGHVPPLGPHPADRVIPVLARRGEIEPASSTRPPRCNIAGRSGSTTSGVPATGIDPSCHRGTETGRHQPACPDRTCAVLFKRRPPRDVGAV